MSFIQLPPDSTGKKVRTNVATDGTEEHLQNYVVSDATGSRTLNLDAQGRLGVAGLGTARTTNRVGIGISAARIDTGMEGRVSVEIHYPASGAPTGAYVYVGFGDTLTTANGRELAPGESWSLDLNSNAAIWAVSTNSGQQIQVTEIG